LDVRTRGYLLFARVNLHLCLAVVLVSCGSEVETHRYTRFAMGTMVEYIVTGVTSEMARAAVDSAHSEVERISDLLWEGNPGSDIARLNGSCEAADGPYGCREISISDETIRFLQRSATYHAETNGAFDVTVGAFLRLYDFVPDAPVVPDSSAVDSALRALGDRSVALSDRSTGRLGPGVRLSVGGVAKGYAVDRATKVLQTLGITGALVNAGGDLYCLGTNSGKPWRVGIRDPDRPGSVVDILELTNRAVATSGDYQLFVDVEGVRYHHLLDPSTGWPARKARSATVVASSTERADALATGLFVGGAATLELIEGLPETEAFLIDPSLEVHATTGLGSLRGQNQSTGSIEALF
jgi:thiamine biosynthesis lipoprotein